MYIVVGVMISLSPPAVGIPATFGISMSALISSVGCTCSANAIVICTGSESTLVLDAPGPGVTWMFIVAVKEFTLPVVFAASWTAASGLAGAADNPPAPAPALEPAAQPETVTMAINASPAEYNERRAARTCI